MRSLVIDDDLRVRCADVRAFAERSENWYRYGQVDWIPGDRPEYVVRTLGGYRAVFTITYAPEQRPVPFRHLTVSVEGPSYPNPIVVWTIAKMLGFSGAEADDDVVATPGPWGVALDDAEHCVVVQQPVEGLL